MTEIKFMDDAGWDFLIHEEGIKLCPYLDSRGIATIGIGMTFYPDTGKRVTMSDPCLDDKDHAIRLFGLILQPFEKTIWSLTRDDINQHQFNSLTSLCYNIGQQHFKDSTVLRLVNANPNDPIIANAFEMWKYSDGKPILLDRRKREHHLYFTK